MRNRNDNIKSIEFTIKDEQQKLEQNVPIAQRNVPNVFSLKYIWKIRGAILFLLSVLSVAIGFLISSKIFFVTFCNTCNIKKQLKCLVNLKIVSWIQQRP